MWKSVVALALGKLAMMEAGVFLVEETERSRLFSMGQRLCKEVGKPFLVVGRPRGHYPCSPDVTLDINPLVLRECRLTGEVGDVRAIPYPDRFFGAAFVSHVLEHLYSLEDVQTAWAELWRVADEVFVAYPRKANIKAQWFAGHRLWVIPHGDWLEVEEVYRPRRRAIVFPSGAPIEVRDV